MCDCMTRTRSAFLYRRSVWYRPDNKHLVIVEHRLRDGKSFFKEFNFELKEVFTDIPMNPLNVDNTSDEYYRDNGYRYIAGATGMDKTKEVQELEAV